MRRSKKIIFMFKVKFGVRIRINLTAESGLRLVKVRAVV